MQKLQGLLDALLCVLPFEPAIWSGAGVDIAHYVGHPVLEPRPAVEVCGALKTDHHSISIQ
jgi:lipid A disaccharide synthetase